MPDSVLWETVFNGQRKNSVQGDCTLVVLKSTLEISHIFLLKGTCTWTNMSLLAKLHMSG